MRGLTIAALIAIVVVLAVLQGLSSIALRGEARGGWVSLVPEAAARRVDTLAPSLPMPGVFRLVLARKALARGDVALADAQRQRLKPSRDRDALAGALAERRGDAVGAVRFYLAAGDLDALERRIDTAAAAGKRAVALKLQMETIARLRESRTDADALAEAYFRLGRLYQTLAYELPIPDRERDQRASYQAYLVAVRMAPLEGRYLLGAAAEALNVDDIDGAQRLYVRALATDPTDADADAGIGETALRMGDRPGAAHALARGRRLDPGNAAVQRLAHELHG